MKHPSANHKTAPRSPSSVDRGPSAGPNGLAITPPTHGIGSVDHGLAEARSSRGTVTQRQADTAGLGADAGARSENKTGLPDNLKSGIESLSGVALDHVRVHYNSSRPAQLQALAYTQGTDIHVAPGQERYLPHEAWHVVQQAQGRVRPTMQLKGGIPVNDDQGLEHEADVIGAKASRMPSLIPGATGARYREALSLQRVSGTQGEVERASKGIGASGEKVPLNLLSPPQRKVDEYALNVVGEKHGSRERQNQEKKMIEDYWGFQATQYWDEISFTFFKDGKQKRGDSPALRADDTALDIEDVLESIHKRLRLLIANQPKGDEYYKKIRKELLLYYGELNEQVNQYKQELKAAVEEGADVGELNLVKMVNPIFEMVLDWGDITTWPTDNDTLIALKSDSESIADVQAAILKSVRLIMPQVQMKRSKYMLDAACEAAEHNNLRGVWKVGNKHIRDMMELQKGKPILDGKVQLTDMDDFADYFTVWSEIRRRR